MRSPWCIITRNCQKVTLPKTCCQRSGILNIAIQCPATANSLIYNEKVILRLSLIHFTEGLFNGPEIDFFLLKYFGIFLKQDEMLISLRESSDFAGLHWYIYIYSSLRLRLWHAFYLFYELFKILWNFTKVVKTMLLIHGDFFILWKDLYYLLLILLTVTECYMYLRNVHPIFHRAALIEWNI